MNVTYVSVWDGGIEVRTKCQFDPLTTLVWDIESSDVQGLDVLEDEYILYQGEEIREFLREGDEGDFGLTEEDMKRFEYNSSQLIN